MSQKEQILKSQQISNHFVQLPYKTVASVNCSTHNYSTQPKEDKKYLFEQTPYQNQQFITKYQSKDMTKLDEQLNNIDRLKTEYESRDQRRKRFNTQNSQKSRSIEKKHNLQPSQIPFLKKRFESHKTCISTKQTEEKNIQFSTQEKSHQEIQLQTKQSQILTLRNQVSKLQQKLLLKDQIIQQMACTISKLRKEKQQNHNSLSEVNQQQNRIMRLQIQTLKQQKQKIETILKQILYEREKQRLFQCKQIKELNEYLLNNINTTTTNSSNGTSSRKSFTPGRNNIIKPSPRDENKNINYFVEKNITTNNRSIINKKQKSKQRVSRQPLQQISNQQQCKKMKVQNILDKLKIKINKN